MNDKKLCKIRLSNILAQFSSWPNRFLVFRGHSEEKKILYCATHRLHTVLILYDFFWPSENCIGELPASPYSYNHFVARQWAGNYRTLAAKSMGNICMTFWADYYRNVFLYSIKCKYVLFLFSFSLFCVPPVIGTLIGHYCEATR